MVLKIKYKPNLVVLPGCMHCNKTCKYNGQIADVSAVDHMGKEFYGCNSALQGYKLDEGEDLNA